MLEASSDGHSLPRAVSDNFGEGSFSDSVCVRRREHRKLLPGIAPEFFLNRRPCVRTWEEGVCLCVYQWKSRKIHFTNAQSSHNGNGDGAGPLHTDSPNWAGHVLTRQGPETRRVGGTCFFESSSHFGLARCERRGECKVASGPNRGCARTPDSVAILLDISPPIARSFLRLSQSASSLQRRFCCRLANLRPTDEESTLSYYVSE